MATGLPIVGELNGVRPLLAWRSRLDSWQADLYTRTQPASPIRPKGLQYGSPGYIHPGIAKQARSNPGTYRQVGSRSLEIATTTTTWDGRPRSTTWSERATHRSKRRISKPSWNVVKDEGWQVLVYRPRKLSRETVQRYFEKYRQESRIPRRLLPRWGMRPLYSYPSICLAPLAQAPGCSSVCRGSCCSLHRSLDRQRDNTEPAP